MKYKVLIVDDDEEIRKYYKNIFLGNNMEVLEANDGLEGLEIATENDINLIMTGIAMPKMNGFDLIEMLRKNIKTASIPVIIFSHLGRKEDQEKAREIGLRDFIIKGFTTPIEIVNLIRSRIEGNKEIKEYLLDINETKMDTQKIIQDIGLNPSLRCPKHPNEKMALLLIAESKKPGEFMAKFICPQEK